MIPINTQAFTVLERLRNNGILTIYGAEKKEWNGTAWVDPTVEDLTRVEFQWVTGPDVETPETVNEANEAINVDGAATIFNPPQIISCGLTTLDNILLPKCAIIAVVALDGTQTTIPVTRITEGMLLDVSALSGYYKIYTTKYEHTSINDVTISNNNIVLDSRKQIHGIQHDTGVIDTPYETIAYGINQTVITFDAAVLTDLLSENPTAELIYSDLSMVEVMSFPNHRDFTVEMEIPVELYDMDHKVLVAPDNLKIGNGKTSGTVPIQYKKVRLVLPNWFIYFATSFGKLFVHSSEQEEQVPLEIKYFARNVLINSIANHESLDTVQEAIETLFTNLDDFMSGGVTRASIVGDIAERDALPIKKTAWVIDASADPTVDSGAALYIYKDDDSTWYKLSETESMDVVMHWADIVNRPTSPVADIDDAVTKRHAFGPNSHTIPMVSGLQDALDNASEGQLPVPVETDDTHRVGVAVIDEQTYGTGADGDLVADSPDTIVNKYAAVTANVPVRAVSIEVDDPSDFVENMEIMIIQMQTGAGGELGQYEFANILNIKNNTVYLKRATNNSYFSDNNTALQMATRTQIVSVPNYNNVYITGMVTAPAWDGNKGGIVTFRVAGTLSGDGSIKADYIGYRGGNATVVAGGSAGEGYKGFGPQGSENFGGGGSYNTDVDNGSGGHSTQGTGQGGGDPFGSAELDKFLTFGGGGGYTKNYGNGGTGGGIVALWVHLNTFTGELLARGEAPGYAGTSSPGGAGGSILFSRVVDTGINVAVIGQDGGGNGYYLNDLAVHEAIVKYSLYAAGAFAAAGINWKLAEDGETIANNVGYVIDATAGTITLNLEVPVKAYDFKFAYRVVNADNDIVITLNGAKWEGVDMTEFQLDQNNLKGLPLYSGVNLGWIETIKQ